MDRASPVCKVALINLYEATAAIFTNAFRQFRIQTTGFSTKSYEGLGQQKFGGCVVRLSPGFEAILTRLRNSPRDRDVFVYGILVSGQTLQEVSKFAINTLMSEPIDRQSVLKIVRATHLLILHEFSALRAHSPGHGSRNQIRICKPQIYQPGVERRRYVRSY